MNDVELMGNCLADAKRVCNEYDANKFVGEVAVALFNFRTKECVSRGHLRDKV